MTDSKKARLGLVLSGGGARGAYEAGVVRALSRSGFDPDVIAGTSIGALNGAVVAAARDMKDAADKLETLWLGLDNERLPTLKKPLRHYLRLAALHVLTAPFYEVFEGLDDEDRQYLRMLDSSPIEMVLKEAIDIDALLRGKPLFVGVYPATDETGVTGIQDVIKDLWRYTVSKDCAQFKLIRDVGPGQAISLLMASAAIPFAFKPVKIDGKWYRDGGMGDRLRCQGNTPVEPLLGAGCTNAIVVFCGDGAAWNRYEWKRLNVIEIRPSRALGGLKSMLNFDPTRIRELIRQGEQEASNAIGKLTSVLPTVAGNRKEHGSLDRTMTQLRKGDAEFENAKQVLALAKRNRKK